MKRCGKRAARLRAPDEQDTHLDHNDVVSEYTLTPHVGARTYESVERQAIMAVENMLASCMVRHRCLPCAAMPMPV